MADTSAYQIAFQFQFQADVSSAIVGIDITDVNSFLISDNEKFQFTPYQGSLTLPMANVSVGSKSLLLSFGTAKAYAGVQTIVWSKLTGGSLSVNLSPNGSPVAVYYSFLGGGGGSGVLQPGSNTISPSVGARHHG